MHNRFLVKLVIPPLAVLVIHIIATVIGWYEAIWYFDKPMHFIGGIAIAISAYYLIAYFEQAGKLQISWKPLRILAITSIVALSAVSWEFMEFYLDSISYSVMQPSVRDTITDLVMGVLGGMITACITTYFRKFKK